MLLKPKFPTLLCLLYKENLHTHSLHISHLHMGMKYPLIMKEIKFCERSTPRLVHFLWHILLILGFDFTSYFVVTFIGLWAVQKAKMCIQCSYIILMEGWIRVYCMIVHVFSRNNIKSVKDGYQRGSTSHGDY